MFLFVHGQKFQPQCDMLASEMPKPPFVSATSWQLPESANANWTEYGTIRVLSYSGYNADSSYCDATTGEPILNFTRTQVGELPQFWDYDAVSIVEEAAAAYNGGAGTWTSQTTLLQRIQAVRHTLEVINNNRDDIIRILMWEISMNYDDAAAEIDRTLEFFDQLVMTALRDPQYHNQGQWHDITSTGTATTTTSALTKRTALGVVLITTYNFPISDIYRVLLPALLMGNVCIVKIPIIGGLVHLFTQPIFAAYLPPGSIYFISAPGPMVLPAMLETGKIDALALYGTVKPTDDLLVKHPSPHKFKTFLQMTARNIAIVLPDLFDPIHKETYYENAMKELISSSLSYSGQLSTAIKVYFVPRAYSDQFVLDLAERVEKVPIGLPWQLHTVTEGGSSDGNGTTSTTTTTTRQVYSQITPLPNFARISYLQQRIDDALRKGARIINANGGTTMGVRRTSLLRPAVLYPLRPNMTFYREESVGPIILVAPYQHIDEAYDYIYHNSMSQQLSIFGRNATMIANVIDKFNAVVGRININTQSSRSPDIVPFTVRRSAGKGIMSIQELLKEFSVPTVLSHKDAELHQKIVEDLKKSSIFMGKAKTTTAESSTAGTTII
jgi:glyceraldehyde-3-phosphate dehydrogenase (NADP+)